ncbi:hypothetical protein BY996DRAFT_6595406, partial [Phakopsora pachyrhizi]
ASFPRIQIARWVMRSRVTKVVRVVRLEGGLGGGSAEFVNGKLDRARRLPGGKSNYFGLATRRAPSEEKSRRPASVEIWRRDGVMNRDGREPREKLFLAKSVEDEAWGIRDRLGGGRMRIDGSAGSGPMANATAAVVEDDCGSAVASVSAAAAATVDDGVGVSVDVISVRFVKGGDHPRGWIWDGMGVSVFAQSRVSDRSDCCHNLLWLSEWRDNVVDEGEIVTKAYHTTPYTVLNRIKACRTNHSPILNRHIGRYGVEEVVRVMMA